MKKLRMGIPKGSLQEVTINLFKKAGFNIIVPARSYLPLIDDSQIELRMLRAQEIPGYVDSGKLDAGLTGKDWILENKVKVKEIADLRYAKKGFAPVRWVLAAALSSKIKSVEGLKGKKIATELVKVTRDYLKKKRVEASVEFSWGATEAKVPELADAIVELVESGETLLANNLCILDVVLESTTRFIANIQAWKDKWKRTKMENISILLKGALLAEEKVGLKMNVLRKDMEKVSKVLPAMKRPTISPLSDKDWVALEVMVNEKDVREIIPLLKRAGAQGIIEYPLNKAIY